MSGQHNPYSEPYSHQQNQQQQQPSYYNQQQQHQPLQSHPPTTTSTSHSHNTSSHPSDPSAPPNPLPQRTPTDLALPSGPDRTHQIEVMQSYEAARRTDDDDANQEILQREFPGIDGSLIAAIYGDSKSLSATREMLVELSEGQEGGQGK